MRDDLDLAFASLRDGDIVTQVSSAAFDFDAIMQELLKGGQVKDLIADGLAAVDGVLATCKVRITFHFNCQKQGRG